MAGGSVEFIGIFILYLLVVFFAAGFFFVVRADRRDAGIAQSWRAYAKRRGYAFSGRQSPDRPFRIEGTRDGIDFRLETDTRRVIVTRLIGHARSAHAGRVVATLGRGRGESDGERAATGDAPFDATFDVRASEPVAVEAVLGPEVRRALQRFPTPMIGAGLRLVVDGDEVLVEWAGGTPDTSLLEAGHAILRAACSVAGASNDATDAEPRPMGGRIEEAWSRVA